MKLRNLEREPGLWPGRRLKGRLALACGAALSLGVLAFLISGRLETLLSVGQAVAWIWVWAAIASALASYAMIGLALSEVLSLLGYHLPFAEVLGIALVSTTANYFISAAGASGFALKAHLLRKRHVPYGTTLTASVLSSAILYIVLAVIVLQGLAYLLLRLGGARIAVMESLLGLGALLGTSGILLAFLFNHKLRSRLMARLFHWLNHAAYFFSRSEIPREDYERFEEQLNRGLERVREHKGHLTRTIAYTCLDWGMAMVTLFLGFKAVGCELSVGPLSAGFAAGQAATLIPLLPGGLGAVEGSMAAVFQGLGVDWGKALMAVLLYRLAYYLVPGAISILVLWGLKVSEPAWARETAREGGLAS